MSRPIARSPARTRNAIAFGSICLAPSSSPAARDSSSAVPQWSASTSAMSSTRSPSFASSQVAAAAWRAARAAARQLAVGDVAAQDVPERVLALAGHELWPPGAGSPAPPGRPARLSTSLRSRLAHRRPAPRPRRPCRPRRHRSAGPCGRPAACRGAPRAGPGSSRGAAGRHRRAASPCHRLRPAGRGRGAAATYSSA